MFSNADNPLDHWVFYNRKNSVLIESKAVLALHIVLLLVGQMLERR